MLGELRLSSRGRLRDDRTWHEELPHRCGINSTLWGNSENRECSVEMTPDDVFGHGVRRRWWCLTRPKGSELLKDDLTTQTSVSVCVSRGTGVGQCGRARRRRVRSHMSPHSV